MSEAPSAADLLAGCLTYMQSAIEAQQLRDEKRDREHTALLEMIAGLNAHVIYSSAGSYYSDGRGRDGRPSGAKAAPPFDRASAGASLGCPTSHLGGSALLRPSLCVSG